jgi:hypothetical protein
MSDRHSLGARLRYRFDNLMAAGAVAVIGWLALTTVLLIVAAASLIALFNIPTGEEGNPGFLEAFWLSLLRTLDPGTMGGDEGWGFRIIALLVTLGGIFIVSILIGLLTTGIGEKLEELRKGRTFVAEKGHTLILGWSPKLFTMISELVVANENQPRVCIVVMAPHDKVDMDDAIKQRVGKPRRTKIVCRTGNPADVNDLEMVNPLEAKSIILLSPEDEAADAQVIKTVLALMSRDPTLQRSRVIAELVGPKSARALRSATEGKIVTVTSSEVIARVTAQVCRQSGMSAVYQELLDFAGHEIYFRAEPSIAGETFGDALFAYRDCAVIGVRFAEGRIELGPPMTTVLGPQDQLIAIAEDDDAFRLWNGDGKQGTASATAPGRLEQRPESFLFIGWNEFGPMVLRQLEHDVVPGSTAHVIYDPAFVGTAEIELPNFNRVTVTTTRADTTEPLPLANVLCEEFDHVVILCYRSGLAPAEADARTLVTLLQVRQLLREEEQDGRRTNVVTELMDVRDVELASLAHPDDFVVSERLTSLLLAQLSENPELSSVFADLFEAREPAEMALRPASHYLPAGTTTFGEAVGAARDRGEVAIGYRKAASDGAPGRVVLNPNKVDPFEVGERDQLIVLFRE